MAANFCHNKLEEYRRLMHLQETTLLGFCVLNLFFCIVATVGNVLAIHALLKASSIPSNLKKFFLSLAFSDLAVGVMAQPMIGVIVALLLKMAANGNYNLDFLCPTLLTACYTLTYLLTCASFLTIIAISLDRLLSIYLHLRYQELVTSKRVIEVLVCLWFASCAAASIFLALPNSNNMLVASIETLGLLLTTVAYMFIYKTVRRHRIHIQQELQLQNRQIMETTRQKKSARSALIVYIVFLLCFLPNLCCIVLLTVDRFKIWFLMSNHISGFLVLLNSSLNPIVYCWRYREIREIIKTTVVKLIVFL